MILKRVLYLPTGASNGVTNLTLMTFLHLNFHELLVAPHRKSSRKQYVFFNVAWAAIQSTMINRSICTGVVKLFGCHREQYFLLNNRILKCKDALFDISPSVSIGSFPHKARN